MMIISSFLADSLNMYTLSEYPLYLSLLYIIRHTIFIHYESRQSSWHVLTKKWSATIHVKQYYVHDHELHDAELYAERTWQLHEFWRRRQKFNAVIIFRARRRNK